MGYLLKGFIVTVAHYFNIKRNVLNRWEECYRGMNVTLEF